MEEEMVVATYADMVYKIAYRYTANPTDAEDVFSETFLAYFKKERVFESEEHRKSWLIRVAINCAKGFLGSRTPWVELNSEITADSRASKVDLSIDLRQAINQLPADYRDVILLYYIEDLSVKQIAEILDRNENTVKTHLSRARDKLRKYLEV
ncbi:MAG: RNA polymerase sigma factor [Bacillota bacterium]|nr:RNA polymerase sigma factor [Bacillota bacterium]